MRKPMIAAMLSVRLRTPLCVLILALAGTATTAAHAQDTPAPPAPAPDPKMAEARRQFDAGVALLDDPEGAKYEEAYRAFKKVYELIQSPKVLGNIGFCAMHLERDGEAIDAYTTYLKEVPDISERERTQIERDLATMSTTVAQVKVSTKYPSRSFVLRDYRAQVRGPRVENDYALEGSEISLRVRAGRHTFQLRAADGRESVPVETTIEPGGNAAVDLVFPPPKKEGPVAPPPPVVEPPSRVGPILLGVVGLAAIGTGVATGIVARNKTKAIERECPDDLCPATYDLDSNKSSAERLGTITDVLFIGGGALVVGAAVWYFVQPRGTRARTAAWLPTPSCGPTGCGLALERGF